jgi:peptidyl-tRNA hydrolase
MVALTLLTNETLDEVDTKLYILVRGDLPVGLQMAQAVHAAIEASESYSDTRYKEWYRDSNTVVVLSVADLGSLETIVGLLNRLMDLTYALHDDQLGFNTVIHEFHEPDLDNELTAVSMVLSRDQFPLLENLPLAGAKRQKP